MVTSNEIEGGLVKTMWVEAGIQYRSNLFMYKDIPKEKRIDTIDIHIHSYDHVSTVTYGWFRVTETTKDGEIKTYQLASRGYKPIRTDIKFEPISYRILIPAYHQHEFVLLEEPDIPAEVQCSWGSDGTEDHHGC